MSLSTGRGRWIAAGIIAVITPLALVGHRSTRPPPRFPDFAGPVPQVAEGGYLRAVHTTQIAAPPGEVRDILSDPSLSLEDVIEFDGGLPPVVGTDALIGSWDPGERTGDRRRVRFADGHCLAEEVLVDEPDRFRYIVWGFTNPLRCAVRHAVAEFRYEAHEGGTLVRWTYSLLPTSALMAPVVSRIVDRTMSPMMIATLDGMRAHVERTVASWRGAYSPGASRPLS
ncbi:SRPBCC family protein [Brachybacterium sp. YJGR34]|uniref:SRPBCC family protein n=1 Tax=Brachybacterium sp. YJGR34 TaxID=2059911 RepID=UPI000E09FF9B|nr:SRPBCC family protein [Brachybacterium sp. YJGR34]